VSDPLLKKRNSPNAQVTEIEGGWRLNLDAGAAGAYRLAQLDDYAGTWRGAFPHGPSFSITLRARASKADLPGTWGFGLWNDPFGFSLGSGGTARRLPSLPNAAWFFFASPENHLSLRNDQPGKGALAGSYRAARIPALMLASGLLAAPLLWLPPASRMLRRIAAHLMGHELAQLSIDPTAWHEYALHWQAAQVTFLIDEAIVFKALAPWPPLGLVLWLDNQYAAWRPDGRVAYGTLSTPPDCWVEIKDLRISPKRISLTE
jgi:hypothetical protein